MKVAAPTSDEGTALVRVIAASINPSDVKNVAGAMPQTKDAVSAVFRLR
jgi:NADPH:quinone reductase